MTLTWIDDDGAAPRVISPWCNVCVRIYSSSLTKYNVMCSRESRFTARVSKAQTSRATALRFSILFDDTWRVAAQLCVMLMWWEIVVKCLLFGHQNFSWKLAVGTSTSRMYMMPIFFNRDNSKMWQPVSEYIHQIKPCNFSSNFLSIFEELYIYFRSKILCQICAGRPGEEVFYSWSPCVRFLTGAAGA